MGWVSVAALGLWLLAVLALGGAARARGPLQALHRLSRAFLLTACATILSGVLIVHHMFYVFSNEDVIATVTVKSVAPGRFELRYTPRTGPAAEPVAASFEGDQWAVSGGIVKWKPWLMLLGLKSYHRPLRLTGQFAQLEAQRRHYPSICPLVPQALDRFWEALYRLQPYLPFVDAVYGSSAYVYAEPDRAFQIAISPTGYVIQRAK